MLHVFNTFVLVDVVVDDPDRARMIYRTKWRDQDAGAKTETAGLRKREGSWLLTIEPWHPLIAPGVYNPLFYPG